MPEAVVGRSHGVSGSSFRGPQRSPRQGSAKSRFGLGLRPRGAGPDRPGVGTAAAAGVEQLHPCSTTEMAQTHCSPVGYGSGVDGWRGVRYRRMGCPEDGCGGDVVLTPQPAVERHLLRVVTDSVGKPLKMVSTARDDVRRQEMGAGLRRYQVVRVGRTSNNSVEPGSGEWLKPRPPKANDPTQDKPCRTKGLRG